MGARFVASEQVAEIRRRLDHPIVDGDGHLVEFLPLVQDLVREEAGPGVAGRFEQLLAGLAQADRLRHTRARAYWALPERNTRVFWGNVYRVTLAEVPLTGPGGDPLGAVRVYEPFQASLSLDNRYIRRIDFEADAEAALGLEKVDLEFEAPAADEEPTPGADARTGRVPLAGILGHTLGTLAVTVRPLEEVLSA